MSQFDIFLLDLYKPLIEYVKGLPITLHFSFNEFYLHYEDSLSPEKQKSVIDERRKKIVELTEALRFDISEALDDDPHHNADCFKDNFYCHHPVTEEQLEEASVLTKKYMRQMLYFIQQHALVPKITDLPVSPEFLEDYSLILHGLVSGAFDLKKAEESLLYWTDAIPDVILQKSLLILRYDYIYTLYDYR